jgi:hypothetical protein
LIGLEKTLDFIAHLTGLVVASSPLSERMGLIPNADKR